MALLSPPRLFFCCSSSIPAISGRNAGAGAGGERGDAEALCLSPRSQSKKRGEKITSTSNPFVKHCVKLRQSSSYRRSCGSALVVGFTPITACNLMFDLETRNYEVPNAELPTKAENTKNVFQIFNKLEEICRFQELQNDKHPIVDCLLLLDGAENPKGLDDSYTSIVHVSPNVMKKLSGMQSVDSIEGIALMRIPKSFYDMDDVNQDEEIHWSCFHSPQRILVLDGIQDPGNLGTLLRSAMAFNWDGIFLLAGCCDPFNEKALRAARGASFQLPLVSGDWSHLNSLRSRFQMKMLAGHPGNCSKVGSKGPSVLSREFADSLSSIPLCLVLGSEGNGLSMQAMQSCELVSIPMAGMFESLNVSIAGGIFLYMLQTQQHR